ncbi:Arabinogalactan protein 20 [Glycine soja]
MTYIASQSGFSFVKILLTKAIFSFFFSLSPPYKPINLSFSHIQNSECGWLCCEIAMEVLKVQVFVMSIVALALAYVAPSINAQVLPPAPAPTSDGIAVDQGIAYVLMLLALVLTYIIH